MRGLCHVCSEVFNARTADFKKGRKHCSRACRKKNNIFSGEKNPAAKLTWEKVIDIRSRPRYFVTAIKLAEEFKVSKGAIHAIRRGKTWSL